MSALPRPDVTGPAKSLNDALHDLHHRAGWPSLRTLARETGVSHTTVSKAFSAPSLPPWGTIELLVEALGGDTATVHDLWLLASTPGGEPRAPSAPRIAGRRAEVAALQRHFRTGAGLILVSGEAGIGKTKVVTTAVDTSDCFVVIGHCLPLSMQVPLMPVADLLLAVHDADGGQRLDEALSAAPAYVRRSLAGLLPEAVQGNGSDDFMRQRLPAALSACLAQLHSTTGLAIVIEDLHWADTATLDMLEHLLVKRVDVPIVGTWRLDDPDTGGLQDAWWHRTKRLSSVETLDLGPLSRDETGAQCRLLGIELHRDAVDEIHRRSGGQPLFTERLVVQAGDASNLPVVLTDVLDRQLDQLDDPAHRVSRALAVADRRLTLPVLAAVTGLDEDVLVACLHDLDRRHLLATSDGSPHVQLKHPLLAEAVRRRLVAGEAAVVHRKLAEVMSEQPSADPAEVAEHWRGSGDRERELEWRIAAARSASARWASRHEAELWLRALELWPAEGPAGNPQLTRAEAYLAAIDALMHSLQFDRAAAMSDRSVVEFPDPQPELRAELLRRAALFSGDREGPEVGLTLIDEAISLLSRLPPGPAMVQAMVRKHQLLLKSGRYAEAFAVAQETAASAEAVGEERTLRVMLGRVAWHQAVTRGLAHGSSTMDRARSLLPSLEDPTGDVWLAVIWTDVLLVLGAGAAEVEAAGRDSLALAEEQGIEDFGPVLVRYNITSALIRDGRLEEATAVLGHEAEGPVDLDRAPFVLARALLDALAGRMDAATRAVETLWREAADAQSDLELVSTIAVFDLWSARPSRAWTRTQQALASQASSTPVALLLPVLVLAARAAADLAVADTAEHAQLLIRLGDMRARAETSGLPEQGWATFRALDRTWSAELARLEGKDLVREWVDGATEWERLRRPHDVAYCRWRAAQVALRAGQGTAAARLLRQATTDAHGHAPLLAAISATRSS